MQQSEAMLVASKVVVPEIAQLLGRTLVIVAHPDDEVIGCGALLQRMREPVVVFCTDGAPRRSQWWQQHHSREAYASLRRNEAQQALEQAGMRSLEFLRDRHGEPFVDQELFRHLPEVVAALQRLVETHRPQSLLTHAYEGGHPDHDACCFVTSVVARQTALPAWEMPLYHRDPQGNSVHQQFIESNSQEIEVDVTAAERERKACMLKAYASQSDIISAFDPGKERVRPLHAYDFAQPPHRGKLNYELWGLEHEREGSMPGLRSVFERDLYEGRDYKLMDDLRILYIAYSLLPLSEASCGGAEQALLLLESQMQARGHDTMVAACSGSRVSGELLSTGVSPHQQDAFELRDAEHIENIVRFVTEQESPSLDLIHDHGGSFWRHAARVDVPVLATLHLPRHFYPCATFDNLPANLTLNCVSESQAGSFRDVAQLSGVVRNGVELERSPFTAKKQNYLLWLGRICPEKGTHVALDVAREAGLPIVVAGQVYPFSYHQDYFRREVSPRLNAMQGTASLLSEVSSQQKRELLRNARAVLIPSLVDETSSLVAMEAMACGTPVVCLRCGALPEVVADHLTGFVVDSAEAMVDAIFNTSAISPHDCRQRVEQNFTADRMADEYEQLYRRVIASGERLKFTEAA